jgi:HSP20 family molecular chaperone IbpA
MLLETAALLTPKLFTKQGRITIIKDFTIFAHYGSTTFIKAKTFCIPTRFVKSRPINSTAAVPYSQSSIMAGMWFPFADPTGLPTADYPHQRLHQHQTLLRHIAGKAPNPDRNPNYPDLDLIDNIEHYLIEVELPGVKRPEDVKCKRTSATSLIVYGEINRTPIESDTSQANGDAEAKDGPYLVIGERRIGTFRRQIHFPLSVSMEEMTAELDAGLLTIRIPKKHCRIPQAYANVEIEVK